MPQRESTRSKDLVDLVLVAKLARLDAALLREGLESIFASRARQPLPAVLPAPPPSWAAPYAELAQEVGVTPDLAAGHAQAGALLDPVLSSSAPGSWNPRHRRWSGRR